MTKIHSSPSRSVALRSVALRSVALRAVLPLVVSCSTESGGPESDPVPSDSATSGTSSTPVAPNSSTSSGNGTTQPSSTSGATSSGNGSSSSGSGTSSGGTSSSATSTAQITTGTSSHTDASDTETGDVSATTGDGTGGSGTTEPGGASSATDDSVPMNNDAVPSAGCGKADGRATLTAGGAAVSGGLPTSTRLRLGDREYIIDIPANYDATHPYRLIFSWHQAYGSANGNAVGQYPANQGPNFNAQNYAYFGLHREATAANDPAIFIAPQGITDFPWDYNRDVALFDDLLELVGGNLCIDESRVFSTGFSFGAMMSHALSLGRTSKLRAVVTMAAANFNFTQPTDTNTPLAYFGITGMSDGTCPWIRNGNSTTEGGKYCVLTHAVNNGCTIPNDIATAMGGSRNHVCYDFEGCDAGYPVKVCTFDGNHTPSAVADGASGGDDGLNAFVPPLAWEFISQF